MIPEPSPSEPKEIMTDSAIDTRPYSAALRRLYVVRVVFALVWAVLLFLTS